VILGEKTMKNLFLMAVIVLGASVFSSAQTRSIYTSTSEKSCKAQKVNNDEGGDYIGICPGVGGYKLKLIEGDLRQTLYVITPQKKQLPLDFTRFYGGFSAIDRKIEWRVKRGVPIALIARYNVANEEPEGPRKSYLMVVTVSRTRACVTDIVKPGKRQNENARKLADAAASKPCKTPE
jgi:hypothetical protein